MATLIAIIFDSPDEAHQVRETLSKGEGSGYISLDDSAVVVRDEEGKIHVKNEVDRGVKVGALWGSLIGLLIGGIFFPIAGLALGLIGGAALGKAVGNSVDPKFVKEVGEELKPGSSAIFYIFRGDNTAPAIAALRPYKGKVLETTLTDDDEKALRDELKSRIK